ncbi:MAG TPA: sel1 repeat family protein, partial [Burkholderiaceae bacterium]|nr:sel1 repeat family protein [Burkholderiaceae bacterium]
MSHLPDMTGVRANLAFTCTHEADRLPSLDPQADQLFKYARYLQTKKGPKNFDDIARYYRIAAAYSHYKANHNLQQLVSEGLASSPYPERESIELASLLIDQGVPTGYYDIGYYLNLGYGLKQNKEMALRYFRKAADLGNADAQFYVADQLAPLDMAPAIAKQMRQCATDQGHGKAALMLAVDLQVDKHYSEAVKAFQKGVQAGDPNAASFLKNGFIAPSS